MQRIVLLTALVLRTAPAVLAQSIPRTVAEAEMEGAAFPRGGSPTDSSHFFRTSFVGMAARKCVDLVPASVPSGGSFRSGDILIRSVFFGAPARARSTYKVLWVPLHSPYMYPDTLVIRGVRIEAPADSLRMVVDAFGYAPRPAPKSEAGFPSLVTFPSAGTWLVLATAGNDWSCFRLTVRG